MTNLLPLPSRLEGSELTIDFLRLTKPIDDTDNDWLEPARHGMNQRRIEGHEKSWFHLATMKGYQTGGIAEAHNDTHRMVEFRGSAAQEYHRFYTEKKGRCRRIDIALTLWFPSYDETFAEAAYKMATRYMVENDMLKKNKPPVITGGLGGWTCYLGSRTSDRYLRIYDKQKQSNDTYYERAWRIELECKGDVASLLWERLRKPETRPHVLQSELVLFLEKYGLLLKGFRATFSATKVRAPQTPDDILKKLEWLNKQVRPVIHAMIERGFYAELMAALELTDAVLHVGE